MAQIDINNLTFSYPEATYNALNEITLSVGQGDYVLLCGPSGSGKTTLLKHLKPTLTPHGDCSGSILIEGISPDEMDARLQAETIGFCMQDPEDQLVTDKVWHELVFGLENLGAGQDFIQSRLDETASFFHIKHLLDQKTSSLSGGQKQLVTLASIMAMRPLILLLDEPMNHPDIDSQELLQSVLKSFEGTIILVSHDRYLIDAVGTQIWEVMPEKQTLNVYKGTYSQYKEYKKQLSAPEIKKEEKQKNEKPIESEKKKLSNGMIWKLTRQREELEAKISVLEKETAELSNQINSASLSFEDMTSAGVLYNKKQQELDELFEQWSEIETKLNEG